MKRTIVNLCLITCLSVQLFAAGLKIESRGELKINNDNICYHPVISEDGNMLLYSNDDYSILKIADLNTMETKIIDNSIGCGYRPVFSPDSKSVYFQRIETVNKLRQTNVERYDVSTSERSEIVPMGRNKVVIRSMKNGVAVKVGNKSMSAAKNSNPLVYNDYKEIVIDNNGIEKRISPVSEAHSYLNASISPDGKKIVFVEPYKGVFTCDLNGENLKCYGKGISPIWLGNDFILLVKSKDDGYFVTESRIYAINLETASAIALTDESQKASEATVSEKANKIVYATDDGKLFNIKFSITE